MKCCYFSTFPIFLIIYNYFEQGLANLSANHNFNEQKSLNRLKRKLPLIFNDFGVSQFVCGFGIPVETGNYESITSGIVFKSQLPLPSKPSELRTHTNHNVNGGRDARSGKDAYKLNKRLRWEFYKALELWANSIGLNGHVCVLKTLCETSQIPFYADTGDLWHEIAHITFIPSSSRDDLSHPLSGEYLAASSAGLNSNNICSSAYKECPKSLLNIFTNIF